MLFWIMFAQVMGGVLLGWLLGAWLGSPLHPRKRRPRVPVFCADCGARLTIVADSIRRCRVCEHRRGSKDQRMLYGG